MDNPKNPGDPIEDLPDFLKPAPTGYVKNRINTHLTKLDKEDVEQLSKQIPLHLLENPDNLDMVWQTVEAMVDDHIARKKAGRAQKKAKEQAGWQYQTPKWLRPQCGAKTRAGGRCRATPVWDKVNNKPRNGRCRMHGGLSTGPKTEEGKRRALGNLIRSKKMTKYGG